jgi:ribonuclease HI
VIYTDGGCVPNPGAGGWAALIIHQGHQQEVAGFEPYTTNNRMELMAAIHGLQQTPAGSSLAVYTDSEYVKNGITFWMPGWRARGWKRKTGVLLNQDLWMELDRLSSARQISWNWVKGHAGHTFNERVDALVRDQIARRGR